MTSDTSVRLTVPVLPALVTAAQFGPYFSWEPWSSGAGWVPWASLCEGDVAFDRVSVARRTLIGMFGLPAEEVPLRVVASVTFLGYASRVVSPLLAAAVAGGELPTPTAGELWWRPGPGGPLPMAYGRTRAQPCTRMDATALAEAFSRVAIGGLVEPLLSTFGERFALSPKVLWGNVASAVAGAAGMIADHPAAVADQPAAVAHPPAAVADGREADAEGVTYAERAAEVVAAMLRRGPLAGMGTLVQPSPGRARRFLVRNNCCLYYRIPGGGTCGDCVLTSPGERRRGWEAALRR